MSGHRRHLKEICESCGFIPAHDVQLEIHHKDRNRSNNAPENLQTLCANCHALVHAGSPRPGIRKHSASERRALADQFQEWARERDAFDAEVVRRAGEMGEPLRRLVADARCLGLTLDEICRITGISRARAREAASGAVAAKEAARHKAIGDPARMSILRQLQRTPELSVSDLIEELALAHPTCRTI
jgi:DNA-binding transcriptional ArsR family regulator